VVPRDPIPAENKFYMVLAEFTGSVALSKLSI
jgi:hypothetical protein